MKRLLLTLLVLLLVAGCAAPLARVNGNRPTVKVFLDIEPDTAKVFLDDVYVGRAKQFALTAGGMDVTVGVHRLRLEEEGFITERLELIGAEGMAPIEVRMLPRPGE